MQITPAANRPGFYRVVPPNGSQIRNVIARTVGASTANGVWYVPFDRARAIAETALRMGVSAALMQEAAPHPAHQLLDAGFWKEGHPHQIKGIRRILDLRRAMLNFKPGLGKTATALKALQLARVSRILIVCPAIVRDTWMEQFQLWWSKAAHEVAVLETGKEARECKAPIQVVSYELLGSIIHQDWGAIVFDESHYLKTPESTRSKEARKVLAVVSKDAYRIWLTGTPIANEPIDLHNQVDLLYPGLFDTYDVFRRAYCLSRENPHAHSGLEWFGLNPGRAAELRDRLSYLSVTATEDDVAELIKKPQFQTIRVRPDRAFNLREYLDNFDRRDPHAARGADAAVRACGIQKIARVRELVEEGLAAGSTHISIMTHLQDTAEELFAELQGFGLPIACVHGANATHKKRHSEIARLAREPKAIYVGTMHAVSTGINELKNFHDVIYAELDYRPDEVVQSMKRYPRIGSERRTRFRVLVLEGTLEERIASVVASKLRDQDAVADIGTLATDLRSQLEVKMSDDEFFQRCQEAAAKMGERDVYA